MKNKLTMEQVFASDSIMGVNASLGLRMDQIMRIVDAVEDTQNTVSDLKNKPTVQHLMDLARKFRSAPGDLYDGPYKALQDACYAALAAQPAVAEPLSDEQIDAIPFTLNFKTAEIRDLANELRKFARAVEQAHGIGINGSGA